MLPLRQSLINFYLEHSSLLGIYTDECRKSPAKGQVHKLRIALKNLKGLIDLLRDLDTGSQGRPGFPPYLKELFQETGELRDIQVFEAELIILEKELGTKFNDIRKILQEEKNNCQARIALVLGELHYWTETETIEQYLYRVVDNYPDEKEIADRILKYILRNWKKIQSLLGKQHTEENLHRIRIRNRNLNSVLSVVQQETCLPGLLPFNPQDLIQFQRLLGKWHDIAVFRTKVRNYSRLAVQERNQRQVKLASLQSSLTLKQRRMKRHIARFIKRFMNS